VSLGVPQREEVYKKFRSIHLFSDFRDDDIEQVISFFHQTFHPKDSVVFYERDLPSDMGSKIYFVVSGIVKLVKYSMEGEGTIVRLASIGEFFGATSALSNKPLPFSAETLTDTTLMYIDRAHFIQLVEKYPRVALKMVIELGEVLWFNYETHNQVVKKADTRVAKIILYHMDREGFDETPDGKVLHISLPHEYISSMTGIAYEESVRIVSRLKKTHGCINYLRGGKIIVGDVKKLRELAKTEELV
jgi:CRP/FNR family transcriptional regulator